MNYKYFKEIKHCITKLEYSLTSPTTILYLQILRQTWNIVACFLSKLSLYSNLHDIIYYKIIFIGTYIIYLNYDFTVNTCYLLRRTFTSAARCCLRGCGEIIQTYLSMTQALFVKSYNNSVGKQRAGINLQERVRISQDLRTSKWVK